jgi:predicted alpha/beta-fold hydrolase
MTQSNFRPPWWLANRHIQSVLASMPPRQWRIRHSARVFCEASQELIVDCGAGVRLLAQLSKPSVAPNGRVVVLLHGWEGSMDSSYILSVALLLTAQGYTVIRLNLRDHGGSHHLNEELFHSCRLAEVVGAVKSVQQDFPKLSLSLVGYSLGGNFALRVGAEAGAEGITIDKIVAICPVLNPAESMRALDTGWQGYRHYFISKWHNSLLKKSAAFPELYSFEELSRFRSLETMTDFLVTGFTEYPDLQSYLRGYAVTDGRLERLTTETSMLLAEDDPVIPIQGLQDIHRGENLTVHHVLRGGHVGFLESLSPHSWLGDYVLHQLQLSA